LIDGEMAWTSVSTRCSACSSGPVMRTTRRTGPPLGTQSTTARSRWASVGPSCWRTTTWSRNWPTSTASASPSELCTHEVPAQRDSSRCVHSDGYFRPACRPACALPPEACKTDRTRPPDPRHIERTLCITAGHSVRVSFRAVMASWWRPEVLRPHAALRLSSRTDLLRTGFCPQFPKHQAYHVSAVPKASSLSRDT
jgi:hypothetical protein